MTEITLSSIAYFVLIIISYIFYRTQGIDLAMAVLGIYGPIIHMFSWSEEDEKTDN